VRILLAEDDPQLGRATQIGLEQSGYAVDWVNSGASALTAARLHQYGCVLLDLGLPERDGMSVLAALRASAYEGAILIVTARDQIPDRIAGLDGGTDDFIIKPFDLDELTARIRSAARRASGRSRTTFTHDDIVIDVADRHVRKDGIEVPLTIREYSILLTLIENRGRILSRLQLEESLYGWGEEVESNAIQVHIHHLRKKLGRSLIRTVHAIGYCIDKPLGENGAAA